MVLLAALDVGGGFGSASAEVLNLTNESMEIEVQVEIESSAEAVVVHFALSGEDPVTLPLVARGDGVFGITTELKPANYEVVFETLGDPSIQSLPVALTDMGAELTGSSGSVTSTTEDGFSNITRGWGWLALAFAAASLAALAFWALGEGREDESVAPEPESDVAEAVGADQAGDGQPSTGAPPDS